MTVTERVREQKAQERRGVRAVVARATVVAADRDGCDCGYDHRCGPCGDRERLHHAVIALAAITNPNFDPLP